MHFYGIQPGGLEQIDNTTKLALLYHARRLQAAARWDFIRDIQAAISPEHAASRHHLVEIIETAFADDERRLVTWKELILRGG